MNLLFPKPIKYQKSHLILPKLTLSNSYRIVYGRMGVIAIESGYLEPKTLEAVRKVIVRYLRLGILRHKKQRSWWIMIFPFHSLTMKPREVRMGKGKGNHAKWVAPVQKGKILFEFKDIPYLVSLKLFHEIKVRLPIKIRLIIKD